MSMSSMSPHFDLLKATTVFHTSQYLSRNYDNYQNVAAEKMVRERQGGKERKRERMWEERRKTANSSSACQPLLRRRPLS